jgi:hypothetical protein
MWCGDVCMSDEERTLTSEVCEDITSFTIELLMILFYSSIALSIDCPSIY